MRFLVNLGHFTLFLFQVAPAALASVWRPGELLRQFFLILTGALPLVVVAGLALGVVVWMHLHDVLLRFVGPSAVDFLPTALTLAVVLEFAPIGSGLVVAGRAGASLGAELGAMKLSEQIDALELLGVPTVRHLIGPRVLACVLALPLLTVFMDYLAVMGSFLAESVSGGTTWAHYQSACLRGLKMGDVVPATLKTLVFGYLIGAAGCFEGLSAAGGTEGVGRAATDGVVRSTLAVLLTNVLLVRLIQFIG